MKTKTKSYEDSVKRLEEIVERLEVGDLPLNDSMKLFEEGTELVRVCNDFLNQAEQKVMEVRKDSEGEPTLIPFGDSEV